MTEEIDMEMTGIYGAMDEGLVILAEEKRKEEDQNLDYEKQLKILEKESFAFLPEILRPFSKLQDMDTYIDGKGCFKPEFIWWSVEIPDLAMIGVFWNSTSENNLKYVVFKPEFNENPGNPFKHADEWNKLIAYRDITDHKIALARAYTEAGSGEPEFPPLHDEINERIAAIDGAKDKKKLLNIPLDELIAFIRSIKIENLIADYGWKLEPHPNKDLDYLVAKQDESLVVDMKLQQYFWNNEGGGVRDWIMNREKMSAEDAIDELLERYWYKYENKNEPEYVPFEQDLIDSNGQFDSPLAMVWSKYILNELVNLINYQIDERLVNIKK